MSTRRRMALAGLTALCRVASACPLIVLLDYWSVWLGGAYAAAKGDAYVAAAEEVTDRVNTVIKSTAAESGSAYVDLRAAFKARTTRTTRRSTSRATATTPTRPATSRSRPPSSP
jgi:hypothetical protein